MRGEWCLVLQLPACWCGILKCALPDPADLGAVNEDRDEEGQEMQEKSLLDLLRELIDRRLVCGVFLAVAGLYLIATGVARLFAASGVESAPLIRLTFGVGSLVAAYLVRHGGEGARERVSGAPSAGSLTSGNGFRRLASQFLLWALRSAVPCACLIVLAGSWYLRKPGASVGSGLLLMTVGTALFLIFIRQQAAEPDRFLVASHCPSEARESPVRWRVAAGAFVLSGLAWVFLSGNRFTLAGSLLWISSIAAWVGAFWTVSQNFRFRWWRSLLQLWGGEARIRMTPGLLLLIGTVAVAAFLRFGHLETVPAEMTSLHVEDLLVANRILNQGERPIFEPSLGGREPMWFYIAALTAQLAATGLTHLTLKIAGAAAGFLALLFIYLLAREICGGALAGLLSMLAAGIAWWPNVLGRQGSSASLGVLFAAAALWLMVRAITRRQRNSALLSGLAAGTGMLGYTPMWIVPAATTLALFFQGLYNRKASKIREIVGYWAASMITTLAVLVPIIRYYAGDRDEFWARVQKHIGCDPGCTWTAFLHRFLRNEWNSFRMFHWTSDSAWIMSPPGQPALDWLMAGLLVLCVALLLYRCWLGRDWREPFILLSVPVLLLPSTLALGLDGLENPSLQRSCAAIPMVFTLVGIILAALIGGFRKTNAGKAVSTAGVLLLAAALAASASANWRIVFRDWASNYSQAVQNASAVGQVVSGFAHSVGSYETVYVKAYPHWVDARAVGIYAGKFGWEQAICDSCVFQDARALKDDARAKLFILHPHDRAFLGQLREIYPDGTMRVHGTGGSHHDFATYFVPGRPGPDESVAQTHK